MKTYLVLLSTLLITFSAYSQDDFYVKIKGEHTITCGDSISLEAVPVTPVNLHIDLFYGDTDYFEYEIVNNESGETVERSNIHIYSTFDTTLYLEKSTYTFKWLYGCANCTNPSIEGQSSSWQVIGDHVECTFDVAALADPAGLTWQWYPGNEKTSKITIAPVNSGYYKVKAANLSGVFTEDSIYITVAPLTVETGMDKSIVCGETVKIDAPVTNYSGTGPLTYKWIPAEGLDNANIAQPAVSITSGITYKLKLSTINGCIASDSVNVSVEPLKAVTSDVIVTCGEAAHLNVATNLSEKEVLSYHWKPETGVNNFEAANPVALVSGPTDFEVVVTTSNGCTDSAVQHIYFEPVNIQPEICMVSADSLNRNMIFWKTPGNYHFDSVMFYKETSQAGIYNPIGSLAATDSSVFTDEHSNSAQQAARYKIAMLDSCGYMTSQSAYHKTIHLSINAGMNSSWNLIWNAYEGFDYSTYHIYRGTSDNELVKIADVAAGTLSYTDLTPPEETTFYQVAVDAPGSCDTGNLKSTSNSETLVRSNMVNTNDASSVNQLSLKNIELYPNPASEKLYINAPLFTGKANIEILTPEGKIIFRKQVGSLNTSIDISNLKKGIYLLKLSRNNQSIFLRFVNL